MMYFFDFIQSIIIISSVFSALGLIGNILVVPISGLVTLATTSRLNTQLLITYILIFVEQIKIAFNYFFGNDFIPPSSRSRHTINQNSIRQNLIIFFRNISLASLDSWFLITALIFIIYLILILFALFIIMPQILWSDLSLANPVTESLASNRLVLLIAILAIWMISILTFIYKRYYLFLIQIPPHRIIFSSLALILPFTKFGEWCYLTILSLINFSEIGMIIIIFLIYCGSILIPLLLRSLLIKTMFFGVFKLKHSTFFKIHKRLFFLNFIINNFTRGFRLIFNGGLSRTSGLFFSLFLLGFAFPNQYLLNLVVIPQLLTTLGVLLFAALRVPKNRNAASERRGIFVALFPVRYLKADWLLIERNAEVRRRLIQKIGYEKILQDLESSELDRWREYALLQINSSVDIEPVHLLKMICPSTQHIHVLRVPPTLTSAREAIRWVNGGIDPEEFVVQT